MTDTTGKELVSAVDNAGGQRTLPFVNVNCAAVPETLSESELLGQTRMDLVPVV